MKEIRYDKEVDAIIIVFSDEKLAYEEELGDIIVGFSEKEEPVWIEILEASKNFIPEILQKISESGAAVPV